MAEENLASIEENAAVGIGTSQQNVAAGADGFEGGEEQAASEARAVVERDCHEFNEGEIKCRNFNSKLDESYITLATPG